MCECYDTSFPVSQFANICDVLMQTMSVTNKSCGKTFFLEENYTFIQQRCNELIKRERKTKNVYIFLKNIYFSELNL